MTISFMYWNDCVDREDMDAMWRTHEVNTEWLDAGESMEEKVHFSRDPDGNLYLTQVEMMAVADVVVRRHFNFQIYQEMICCIAELESNRQPFAIRYDKKTKQTLIGLMQISSEQAQWLAGEGFQKYRFDETAEFLYKPFVSVYLGAAYLSWLSTFDQKERSEEFVVRAYKGGTRKATHKSTLQYWKRYLAVKETLPRRSVSVTSNYPPPQINDATTLAAVASHKTPTLLLPVAAEAHQQSGGQYSYWDSLVSPEDMQAMWNHPEVSKEWTKSGDKQGKVRFSHDHHHRPYLSQTELKAVAEIILLRYYSTHSVKPSVLCALAEMVSMRFLHGIRGGTGLMGIDYSKAYWLYMELGYRAYRLDSVDDLTKPFVSMYFGAAYLRWLSHYEGRERAPEFVIQAFVEGPTNVNFDDANPLWLRFEQTLSNYEDVKKETGSCIIL